jgi:hypothetical protein
MALLPDGEVGIQAAGAHMLGQIGHVPDAAISALVSATESPDAGVQAEAVVALGRISAAHPPEQAAEIVGLLLQHLRQRLRGALPIVNLLGKDAVAICPAVKALGLAGPAALPAIPVLVDLLKRPSWIRIAWQANRIGLPVSRWILELNWVAREACDVLAGFGPAAARGLRPLARICLGRGPCGSDDFLREQAMKALVAIDKESRLTVSTLTRGLRDRSRPVQDAVVSALLAIGQTLHARLEPLVRRLGRTGAKRRRQWDRAALLLETLQLRDRIAFLPDGETEELKRPISLPEPRGWGAPR